MGRSNFSDDFKRDAVAQTDGQAACTVDRYYVATMRRSP